MIFAHSRRYAAESKVLVNTRTALQPALEGLVVAPDVSGELDYVRQALLSGPQLSRFAQQVGLVPASGLTDKRRAAALSSFAKRVDITIDQGPSEGGQAGSATYGIMYTDVNQQRALALVKLLTSDLVNETLGGSEQGSEHAQEFLKSQIDAYEKRLQDAEDRLAAFKSQHFGLLPTRAGQLFQQLRAGEPGDRGHQDQAVDRAEPSRRR